MNSTSSSRKQSPLKRVENQENRKPYACQRVTPQDPSQRLRMQVRRFWQQRQAEFGTLMVQEAFQQTLNDLGVEMNHDVLGCRDCYWNGDVYYYCIQSRHHHEHPYHVCPGLGQECC